MNTGLASNVSFQKSHGNVIVLPMLYVYLYIVYTLHNVYMCIMCYHLYSFSLLLLRSLFLYLFGTHPLYISANTCTSALSPIPFYIPIISPAFFRNTITSNQTNAIKRMVISIDVSFVNIHLMVETIYFYQHAHIVTASIYVCGLSGTNCVLRSKPVLHVITTFRCGRIVGIATPMS